MNTEEKAKAYDEAKLRMSAAYNSNRCTIGFMNEIFPELKESEGERIRRIICSLTYKIGQHLRDIFTEEEYQCFDAWSNAWLKKQGNITKLSVEEYNKIVKGVFSNCAMSFINYLDVHKYIGKMCVSNGECEDIENSFRNAMWDRLHRYYCKYIEKQDEQKSDKVEPKFKVGDIVKRKKNPHLTYILKRFTDDGDYEFHAIGKDGHEGGCTCFAVVKYQDEWELVEQKTEPKFKNGQWIVWQNKCYKVNDNSCGYKLIDQNGLSTSLEYGTIDESARLWDITRDAKAGDVLACKNGWTCIFKTLGNDETFSSYCFMDNTKWFCETGCECHTLEEEFVKAYNGKIYPATKEQRDTFERAMADAGYTFDFEKKELKKIEQKSTITPKFKVGDIIRHTKIGFTCEITAVDDTEYRVSGYSGGSATSLPFDFQDAWELVEQKSADWSEEDEYLLDETIKHLEALIRITKKQGSAYSDEIQYYQRDIDWLKNKLKFLRPQNWTKEDKERYISCLQKLGTGNPEQPETINSKWFKEHVYPQFTWKPSLAQLNALSIVSKGNVPDDIEAIVSLYNDLKKLREE